MTVLSMYHSSLSFYALCTLFLYFILYFCITALCLCLYHKVIPFLFIYLSINQSVSLFIHLFIYLFVYLSFYLSVYVTINQSIYIHLSITLSFNLHLFFYVYLILLFRKFFICFSFLYSLFLL